ncbi:hypothetical protein LUZ60_013689 [Juncus effusus]|nr:hypothetical protein LUZ60_013689 [Juncus effusus]
MNKDTFWCIFCSTFIPALFIVLMCVFLICVDERVHVRNASLTRFDLDTYPFPTFHYNLSLLLTIYNPNWYNGIDYNHMEADFLYLYEKFDWVLLPDLYLHKKKIMRYNLTLGGNSTVLIGGSGIDSFKKSNETGYFSFELHLKGYKRCKTNANHYDFLYVCPFTLHVDHESTNKDNFEVVKCYSPSPPPSDSDY